MASKKGEPINGILLLDKPLGISSNLALQKTRFLFQARKAGHTGSLDPLACGMLPICFGEATKFSQFLLAEDKCYQATLSLGSSTTTGDAEGEILATAPVPTFTIEQITSLQAVFPGKLQQIPPMYSALKHQGQPLYKIARKGLTIEREAREIVIHDLKITDWCPEKQQISFQVVCSKGTYIRTLAEQMAQHLGCLAHLVSLRRLWVKPFQQYPMISLQQLADLCAEQRMKSLISLKTMLSLFFPSLILSEAQAELLRRGQKIKIENAEKYRQGLVTLCESNGLFLGLGTMYVDGLVVPKRLVATSTERVSCTS